MIKLLIILPLTLAKATHRNSKINCSGVTMSIAYTAIAGLIVIGAFPN
jgi:hypothetical protein